MDICGGQYSASHSVLPHLLCFCIYVPAHPSPGVGFCVWVTPCIVSETSFYYLAFQIAFPSSPRERLCLTPAAWVPCTARAHTLFKGSLFGIVSVLCEPTLP